MVRINGEIHTPPPPLRCQLSELSSLKKTRPVSKNPCTPKSLGTMIFARPSKNRASRFPYTELSPVKRRLRKPRFVAAPPEEAPSPDIGRIEVGCSTLCPKLRWLASARCGLREPGSRTELREWPCESRCRRCGAQLRLRLPATSLGLQRRSEMGAVRSRSGCRRHDRSPSRRRRPPLDVRCAGGIRSGRGRRILRYLGAARPAEVQRPQ